MPRIELLAANFNAGAMQVYADFRSWLARHDVKLTLRQCGTEAELIHHLRSADVLLAFRIPVTRRVIAASPRLRLIMASGNGYDHVDVAAATEHGVPVTCGRRYNVQDVAEHAVVLMLWCGRKIGLLQAGVRRNAWPWPCGAHVQPVSRLAGRTVGIVGFGLIGRAVAALARSLGLTVCAHDPYLPAERIEAQGAAPVSLTELLQRCDFVSLHLRANAETTRLIGEPQLRMMRRTAYVINTSRGQVIDEPALVRALREGWIAGAGLDVLASEPPPADHPLLSMDNVLITGHAAGSTVESTVAWREEWQQIVADHLRGVRPINVVNPEVKAKAATTAQHGQRRE